MCVTQLFLLIHFDGTFYLYAPAHLTQTGTWNSKDPDDVLGDGGGDEVCITHRYIQYIHAS
jgi:hypothetical protein